MHYHTPVLLNETISGLNINPDGFYLDCTIGGGGHSLEILKKLSKKGKLIGVDKDIDAILTSKERLKKFKNVYFIKSDFKDLEKILNDAGERKRLFCNDNINERLNFDGILIDLGVSSHQIDSAERGFSFLKDGPLDMRMNIEQDLTAFEVVNFYSKEKLEKILFEYGEEKNAKLIVNAILKTREFSKIQTTKQLNEVIEKALPAKFRFKGASQKTFQAIRIEVNSELEELENSIRFLVSCLKPNGRIAIITFHSLEDRIVKKTFSFHATGCICPPKTPVCICGHKPSLKLITKKPITSSQEEISSNSRCKSAKLRIAEKI